MSSFDWAILLPIVALGAYGFAIEGKLNFKGVLIEPLKTLLALLRTGRD